MQHGRPKPTILLSHVDQKTNRATEICEGSAIFMVLYQGTPFNIRKQNPLLNVSDKMNNVLYKSSAYIHVGHARAMAARLNELFRTTDFKVIRVEPKDGTYV